MKVMDPHLGVLPKSGLLIGADHIADTTGGEFKHVFAATGKPTVAVALAGAHEIDLAVRAARAALPGWRATPVDQRREAMLRYAQLLRHTPTS
jgi:aldehyde dehydrogenase (NAD+)